MSKSTKLENGALEKALEIVRLTDQRSAALAALQKQAETVHAEFLEANTKAWKALEEELGISDLADHTIEARFYREHGLMFLLSPEPSDPAAVMAQILEGAVARRLN